MTTASGGPPISSLSSTTDNPGPSTGTNGPLARTSQELHAPTARGAGGPPKSSLTNTTDNPDPSTGTNGPFARTPFHLAEMTTIEAAEAVAAGTVVIIPAGAFEQHGPGMPLATDLVRAEGVVDRVVTRLDGAAIVGPAIPVGVSPHHLAFAGTVTFTTTTFAAVVREYVDSLYRHGWRKILVVTGHGGNNAALTAVGQDLLTTHPELQFAWTPVTPLAKGSLPPHNEVHGHGGEAETAQMLYLAPETVRRDQLTRGTTTLAELSPVARLARRDGHPSLTIRYDQLSPIGILGDPTTATAEAGQSIVDAVVTRIADYVTEWLAT